MCALIIQVISPLILFCLMSSDTSNLPATSVMPCIWRWSQFNALLSELKCYIITIVLLITLFYKYKQSPTSISSSSNNFPLILCYCCKYKQPPPTFRLQQEERRFMVLLHVKEKWLNHQYLFKHSIDLCVHLECIYCFALPNQCVD